MHLNDAGRMVHAKIANTPHCYPGVLVDRFIVMPDHVHAIIVLHGQGPLCPPWFIEYDYGY